MAEADRPHRAPRVWPWVVGLVALALAVWALSESLAPAATRSDETTREGIEELAPPPPAPQMGVRIT